MKIFLEFEIPWYLKQANERRRNKKRNKLSILARIAIHIKRKWNKEQTLPRLLTVFNEVFIAIESTNKIANETALARGWEGRVEYHNECTYSPVPRKFIPSTQSVNENQFHKLAV